MINRQNLIETVKSGRTVVLQLTNAEVVFRRKDLKPLNHYSVANLYKVIVKDPTFGTIFFSGFSQKLADIEFGDKVSLKVTVTGVGDPSDRYPEPILFAKPNARRGDSIMIDKQVMVAPDLTVNV